MEASIAPTMKDPTDPTQKRDWFVVGFAIAEDTNEVLLLEKQKEWCRGLWNGVGGLVEFEDGRETEIATAQAATAREFEEETALGTHPDEWQFYCDLIADRCRVSFLRLFTTHDVLKWARTTTNERVALVQHSLVQTMRVFPNLRWLVPMALHKAMATAQVSEDGDQYDGSR